MVRSVLRLKHFSSSRLQTVTGAKPFPHFVRVPRDDRVFMFKETPTIETHESPHVSATPSDVDAPTTKAAAFVIRRLSRNGYEPRCCLACDSADRKY
jgi:hypothetical protein